MSNPTSDWQCTWITGPDAGSVQPLSLGRHLVGRAHTAEIRCDDPALQPHHAIVDVRPDGEVHLAQLTGRVPLRLHGVALDRPVTLVDGDRVEIGGSLLSFTRGGEVRVGVTVHDQALLRGPRAVPRWEAADLTPPSALPSTPETTGGLLPAMLGLLGAGAIALLLRQPMFLLFGAMGAVVAVGSWVAQRISGRRRRRRDRDAAAAERAAFEAALAADRDAFLRWHRASVPTVVDAHGVLTGRTAALWTRRCTQPDAYTASLGLGDQPWRAVPGAGPHTHPEPLVEPDLPVPASLGAGTRLALQGPHAVAIARAVIAQLVANCGPADVRLVVVTEHPGRWDCLRGLPHLRLPDGTSSVVDEGRLADTLEQLTALHSAAHPAASGESPIIVVVTDHVEALGTRTSPLRRAVNGGGTALLAVLPDHDMVPHVCTAVLATGQGPMGRWVADTSTTLLPVPVRVAGLGEQAMFRCCSAIADLHDPEDPLAAAGRLPRDIGLAELMPMDAESVRSRWALHTDPAPRTPIGIAADGMVDIDLVRDGPHALIAGTTGAGKSELLRSLVVGMAAHASPQHLTFVLVDYKGGAAFDACGDLPHVVGVITDLDDQLADRALRSLHAELRRREALLRAHRAADLAALRAQAPHVVLPRLVVVIDEFAALVAEQPEFLHALVGVAQRGRSLGVHLLLATQRPHGVISDDIRANTNLRVALRLHDSADAVDVVGDQGPALLPRTLPGRAVMRLGADEYVTFQTARCEPHLVEAVADAARSLSATPPPAPWQPPLPATLPRSDLPAGAVALADDPDSQCRQVLRWSPADGSVLVVGSAGAGVSSTLHTLAVQALAEPDVHVYVLVGHVDQQMALLHAHPRCVVVSVHERERTMRLLHRLLARVRKPAGGSTTVVVVDGLDLVRRSLDEADTMAELDALDDVLTRGDSDGLVLLAGTERTAAVPAAVLAKFPHRWVLHLHDPLDAGQLGVAPRQVPPATPGRMLVTELGLVAQVAEPGGLPLYDATTGSAVESIDATPARVDGGSLPPARHSEATTHVPLGLAIADGDVSILELPDGDHLTVVGGARTGRSTALARLTECWRAVHPDGRVLAVLPRRSTFPPGLAHDVVARLEALPLAIEQDLLVVVDDAELVDDPGGVLATMAASGRGDRTVFAAARPDALRHAYGHWTGVLRRSRLGLVSTGGGDLDGDLLGVTLPRRLPVPARPGLMWMVSNATTSLVQVALPSVSTTDGVNGPVGHVPSRRVAT